jgi:four helix bundle protein
MDGGECQRCLLGKATVARYEKLRAWQIANELAIDVNKATRGFPVHERFELASQLRRAALAVPTNLAEGRARYGRREFLRFVRIAASSLGEVEHLLQYARRLGYLTSVQHARLADRCRHATTLVVRLARSLQDGEG